MLSIDTTRFASILPGGDELSAIFPRTAFVISHKSESLETLLGVLWYLPTASPIFILTNCQATELENLTRGIAERLTDHQRVFLVHQKDPSLAAFFHERGIFHIVGTDGRVIDGKGEGMYIGALCAYLLGGVEWIVYYDADNFAPSALMEYTLAMGRLFLAARTGEESRQALHNVRICWASKPSLDGGIGSAQVMGRCSRVVSPLVSLFLEEITGRSTEIITSNAGEQGLSLRLAQTLRYSSSYSVETFLLLDLIAHGVAGRDGQALLQQYQAQSPHFHAKGDDAHIKRMIAESLGCFFLFPDLLTARVEEAIARVCADLSITPVCPRVYPALESLALPASPAFLHPYRLEPGAGKSDERAAFQTAALVG